MSKIEEDRQEIRERILFFLYRNSYWQKRHTPKINICNKLSDIPCKYINKKFKKLYKEEFIRFKKTNHGEDVFLIIKKKREIENEIEDKLNKIGFFKYLNNLYNKLCYII